jgi:hypothetical protein
MSHIFDAIGLYEIGGSRIDPSPLATAEELITFQLAQRQGLLVFIQVVSNKIFGTIAKLKTPHDIWIYLRTSYRRDSTLCYVFALQSFMHIKPRISAAKVSPSEFISAFDTDWNRISHLAQSSPAAPPLTKNSEGFIRLSRGEKRFSISMGRRIPR